MNRATATLVLAHFASISAAHEFVAAPELSTESTTPSEKIETFGSDRQPCGSDTIVVFNGENRTRHVFCVSEEAGVIVLESRSDDGSESALSTADTPLESLTRIAPADIEIPDDVLQSIRENRNYRTGNPYAVGSANLSSGSSLQTAGACPSPAGNYNISQFLGDPTFCGWVGGPADKSSDNPPWRQRTASLFPSVRDVRVAERFIRRQRLPASES